MSGSSSSYESSSCSASSSAASHSDCTSALCSWSKLLFLRQCLDVVRRLAFVVAALFERLVVSFHEAVLARHPVKLLPLDRQNLAIQKWRFEFFQCLHRGPFTGGNMPGRTRADFGLDFALVHHVASLDQAQNSKDPPATPRLEDRRRRRQRAERAELPRVVLLEIELSRGPDQLARRGQRIPAAAGGMRHVAADGFGVRLRCAEIDFGDDVAVQRATAGQSGQPDGRLDFVHAIGGDDVALLDDAVFRLERKVGPLLPLLPIPCRDDVVGVPGADREQAVLPSMTAGDNPFQLQRDRGRAHTRTDEHRAPRVDIRAEIVRPQQRRFDRAVQPGQAARWRRGDDLRADRLPVRGVDLLRIALQLVARRDGCAASVTSQVAILDGRFMLLLRVVVCVSSLSEPGVG